MRELMNRIRGVTPQAVQASETQTSKPTVAEGKSVQDIDAMIASAGLQVQRLQSQYGVTSHRALTDATAVPELARLRDELSTFRARISDLEAAREHQIVVDRERKEAEARVSVAERKAKTREKLADLHTAAATATALLDEFAEAMEKARALALEVLPLANDQWTTERISKSLTDRFMVEVNWKLRAFGFKTADFEAPTSWITHLPPLSEYDDAPAAPKAE